MNVHEKLPLRTGQNKTSHPESTGWLACFRCAEDQAFLPLK
jgi:hypothetical protein